ncbi:hypothetical protein ABT330_17310 [Streptomyces sp. NPDC000658]|uniref:hypothetical protein n=1 Tax=Streptomyces sp. NPDC000658 TaxID=3154266 RepID=UPI0033207377
MTFAIPWRSPGGVVAGVRLWPWLSARVGVRRWCQPGSVTLTKSGTHTLGKHTAQDIHEDVPGYSARCARGLSQAGLLLRVGLLVGGLSKTLNQPVEQLLSGRPLPNGLACLLGHCLHIPRSCRAEGLRKVEVPGAFQRKCRLGDVGDLQAGFLGDIPQLVTAGGALALWADAPAAIVVPVTLLIILDIRVRLWCQHT